MSRWSTGAYICVVMSGVSPAISRRIMLNVQFPPMMKIPSQVISAVPGQSVTLECITEVSPSLNFVQISLQYFLRNTVSSFGSSRMAKSFRSKDHFWREGHSIKILCQGAKNILFQSCLQTHNKQS